MAHLSIRIAFLPSPCPRVCLPVCVRLRSRSRWPRSPGSPLGPTSASPRRPRAAVEARGRIDAAARCARRRARRPAPPAPEPPPRRPPAVRIPFDPRQRRDLLSRRRDRGQSRNKEVTANGQGRAPHAPRNGARGLAPLRLRRRRDLGAGRRDAAPGHRLDHRPRGALQAGHRNRLLHLAALLHRRERVARHRPPRSASPAPTPTRRRTRSYTTCVAPRDDWYIRMDELEVDKLAQRRHRARRDARVPRHAGRVPAVARVPAVGRAQVRLPDAGAGLVGHARLRRVDAVLPESRAELRRDADAAHHDQARLPAGRAVPLPAASGGLGRRSRRNSCRTTARPAPTATCMSWKHNQSFDPYVKGLVGLREPEQGVRRHVLLRSRPTASRSRR